MHTPDIGLRYRQLVTGRRQLGDLRYGTRHLDRGDLAHNRVQEAADAVVYMTLTRRAWAAGQLTPSPAQADRLARLAADARRLGEQCSLLADPAAAAASAFAGVLRDRFAYGERHYHDAYLSRENLWEALEEIADCDILVALDRERHARLTHTPHPHAPGLQDILRPLRQTRGTSHRAARRRDRRAGPNRLPPPTAR